MDIEQLVAAAQAGDQDAREQVGEWLFVELGRYLARWGFPADQAADVRQQSCVAVLELLHVFEDRGPDSFSFWTREIARRRAKNRWAALAREAAKQGVIPLELPDSTLSLTSKLTMLELDQLLDECAGAVSEVEREAMLWEFEDLGDHELARLRGVTVNTIRTRRHRGYQHLAECMRQARRSPVPQLRAQPESSSSPSP